MSNTLWLAVGALNQQLKWSSSNSGCSMHALSSGICLAFLCTALLNILQSCFCDLYQSPSLHCLFVQLLYQVVMLNEKMLSTRLLDAISNMCLLIPQLLICLIKNSCWVVSLKNAQSFFYGLVNDCTHLL